jgi:hypothetical protein
MSNQIWFPKGKSQTKTSIFQIKVDGKRYTALSVGRDFTSQGKENNLRKEKRERSAHPYYFSSPMMIYQIVSAELAGFDIGPLLYYLILFTLLFLLISRFTRDLLNFVFPRYFNLPRS